MNPPFNQKLFAQPQWYPDKWDIFEEDVILFEANCRLFDETESNSLCPSSEQYLC